VTLPRTVSLWLPVLLWAALIYWFSSIPSLSSGLGSFDYVLRKAAHVTEFAFLSFLLWRAVRDEAGAFFGALLYAATDEFHQTFVHGRHGSPKDLAFDAVGALLGLVILSRAVER
jgi:VanZ family protein